MKYLKTYESIKSTDESILDKFYTAFDEHEKYIKNKWVYDSASQLLKHYNVPEVFLDEFRLLHFLYDNRFYRTGDKKTDNKVKNLIKKKCLDSIVNKIDNEPSLYVDIKEMFDKRPNWNDSNRFGNVSNGPTKYIYYMLYSAINKNAPDYIKDTNKYNL